MENKNKQTKTQKKEAPFWATDWCYRCGAKIDNSNGYPTCCPKCHTSFLD